MTALIAGIDEAGRGPLAGPVTAAAVILPRDHGIHGLADSKKLSAKQRERLAECIITTATSYAIATSDPNEIDQINILQASLLAMQRAVAALTTPPQHALIDGTHCPQLPCTTTAIIGGDKTVAEISAASILAKVARDNEMLRWHARYPNYHFDKHKGYPTKLHLAQLQKYGPCPIHRRSFAPVAKCLACVS